MILPAINIDTMDLSREFDLTREDVDDLKSNVVKTVTKVVHTAWREQAKKSLGSTRNQYMNSIIAGELGPFTNTLTLVGTLPNMIESGKDPFDMKKGFEASDKKIITRDKDGNLGWYLTIPFTWAQTGSLGESQSFTGVMPKDIQNALKSKQKTHGQEASLTLSDIPSEFKIPKARPPIKLLDSVMVPEYQHKSSIYEGMSQKKKGGSIMSFRRVSSNSDDASWWHSGIKAHNLAEKAVVDAKIPEVVKDIIDNYLENKLG